MLRSVDDEDEEYQDPQNEKNDMIPIFGLVISPITGGTKLVVGAIGMGGNMTFGATVAVCRTGHDLLLERSIFKRHEWVM